MAETCINCQHEITEKFCPACGQRVGVKRITVKESWFDFWSRVYGFDGMFPRTLRDLTIRPGVVAKRFIAGNRVLYYGPVGYFFLIISLCLLFFSMIDVSFLDFMKNAKQTMPVESNRLSDIIMVWAAENIKFFVFMLIPFQAFTAKYIFFRKSGYNFLENMVLPLYVAGHMYWVTAIIGLLYKLTGFLSLTTSSVIAVLYMGFAFMTMMTYQSKVKAFIKGIGLYAVSYVLFVIVFSLVLGVVIVILAFVSPETVEMIKPSNN